MRRIFILLSLAMLMASGIGGCGGGSEGTSADPLGTDGLTFGHKINVEGTEWSMALQVNPGDTAVLTAKVINASGKPVVGREVGFVFMSNRSGATINVSRANTDGAGEAVVIYHAGPGSGFDTVRASLSNGSRMETNITVGTAVPIGRTIALQATPTILSAGQSSILTATVTDSADNPVMGQFVSFSYVSNLSGANMTTLNGGITDAGGHAIAVHNAGSLLPTAEVQDIVSASIAGTAAGVVNITRMASTAMPPAGNRLGLASDLASLAAGQNAVISATVTNASGTPVGGVTVTFSLLNNTSGATLTTLSGGVTDAGGTAVAVYTAGANTPASSLQDTIQASITGSTGALVMTRTAAGGGGVGGGVGGVRVNVTAAPTSLNVGALSVITATVANAIGPVAGQTVTFAIMTNNSGAALTTVSTTTDASGTALVTYTAGSTSPTVTVQDVVTATVPGSAGAVIITRTGTAVTGYTVTLTPPGDFFGGWAGKTVEGILTARVRNSSSQAVSGMTVTFSIESGGGALTSATAVTNASGEAVTSFFRPATEPAGTVIFVIFKATLPDGTETIALTRIDA